MGSHAQQYIILFQDSGGMYIHILIMLTSDIQIRLNCAALYAVAMLLILGLTPIEESPSV